jgi:hypothetical protein
MFLFTSYKHLTLKSCVFFKDLCIITQFLSTASVSNTSEVRTIPLLVLLMVLD